MLDIEMKYNELKNDLHKLYTACMENVDRLDDELFYCKAYEDIKDAIAKARLYDIRKYKQSEGGKKSALNLSKQERTERARKAGKAKGAKAHLSI